MTRIASIGDELEATASVTSAISAAPTWEGGLELRGAHVRTTRRALRRGQPGPRAS